MKARQAFELLGVLGCLHCSTESGAGGPGATNGDGGSGTQSSSSSHAASDTSTNAPSASGTTGSQGGSGSTRGPSSSTGSSATSMGNGGSSATMSGFGAGGSSGAGGGNSGGVGGGASSGGAGGNSSGGTGTVSGEPVAGDTCSFSVAHEQSSAIGTVTIVSWSSDLGALSEARILFRQVDAAADASMTAPVALDEPGFRTLLLGMKADRNYEFRIVAETASTTCTSAAVLVRTAPLPDNIPVITKTTGQAGGVKGFFVTTPGLRITNDRGLPGAYIFDTDGDVVWWTPDSVEHQSSARLSWDGRTLWHVNATGGLLHKTSMDGLTTESVPDLNAHHDLVALPEGGVAVLAVTDNGNSLVEVKDDATFSKIADARDLYDLDSYHPNALAYQPDTDTFTISDLVLDGFVKITRTGQLLWQLGGTAPKADAFELVGMEPWEGNHGHELGPDGQFLFFNNFTDTDTSRVLQLSLDEANWTAEKTLELDTAYESRFLGGVQRLPNGNYAIVSSMSGTIDEVTAAGELVQRFDNSYSFANDPSPDYAIFGYARYRSTLYGPPASSWSE